MATQQSHPSIHSDDDSDFQQALRDFLAQLSNREKDLFKEFKSANYRNSSEFLANFEKFGASLKHKKFGVGFQAVKRLSDKLNPYFAALDIIVTSHPEWTAIAWGAFRLVLQLAVNFATFFEKLGDLLAQVSARLPAYRDISKFDRSGVSDRLKLSIRGFYIDLFELFSALARIFTQKSGKLQKTPIVIAELLWQPFEARFSSFISRLQFHHEVIQQEVRIDNWSTSRKTAEAVFEEQAKQESFRTETMVYFDMQAAMEKEFSAVQRELLVERIHKWINPPCFAQPFERALKARQNGTAEWLFDNETFQEWDERDPAHGQPECLEGFLWIQGSPGAGKTVLAASTVDHFQACTSKQVCYFFFEKDAAGKSIAEEAYRSFLAQIFQQHNTNTTIVDLFTFFMSGPRQGQTIATEVELIQLLLTVLTQLDASRFVVDAVDECDKPNDLMKQLLQIKEATRTKLLVFSRPNVAILRQKLKGDYTLLVNRAHVHEDLRQYFERHLQDMRTLAMLPEDVHFGDLVKHLLLGADGMFQWAFLMMAHLRSDAMWPEDRKKMIQSLKSPEGLDVMYLRILETIAGKRFVDEQILARHIFMWLVFRKAPLSAKELQEIITMLVRGDIEEATSTVEGTAQPVMDFENKAVVTCGSLVERRYDGDLGHASYRFIHLSAFEFFLTRCEAPDTRCGSKVGTLKYFFPPVYEAEAQLAMSSLSYVTRYAPGKPLSGSIFERAAQSHVETLPPFLSYACLNWPSHLAASIQLLSACVKSKAAPARSEFSRLLRILSLFFEKKLAVMSWLEVIYSLGRRSDTPADIYNKLQQWCENSARCDIGYAEESLECVSTTVSAFATELATLHRLWGDTLRHSPHQIWNDMTAFTPSPFFVKTSAVVVKPLVADDWKPIGLSSRPLSRISREATDGNSLATLTIWPSQDFELQLKNKQLKGGVLGWSNGEASGWVAHYQLWNLQTYDPTVIEEYKHPLLEAEVAFQIRRFGKLLSSKGKQKSLRLTLHFPSSIGEDLDTFTVLRTVLRKIPPSNNFEDGSGAAHSWMQVVIPVAHEAYMVGTVRCMSMIEIFEIDRTEEYKLTPFGDYVLYEGYEAEHALHGRPNRPREIDVATTIAVFELKGDTEQNNVALLGCMKGRQLPVTRCASARQCLVHPHLPLMAFYLTEPYGSGRIILWCFTEGQRSEQHLPLCFPSLAPYDSASFTCLDLEGELLQSLQFSASGKELVYMAQKKRHPTVLSIDAASAYTMAKSGAYEKVRGSNTSQEVSLTKSSATQFLGSHLEVPRVFAQGDILVHNPQMHTMVGFDLKAATHDVQLVHTNGGFEERQSLLSLPRWADSKHVKVSVHMPTRNRRDKIRIVLNKSPKTLYTFSNDVEESEPAVVDKEMIALPPIRKSILPATSNDLQEANSQSSSDSEDSTESERPAKRPRRVSYDDGD